MFLLEIFQYVITALFVASVFAHAGFGLHELAHYKVVTMWTEEAKIKFKFTVPRKVNFNEVDLSNRGLRIAAIAPTVVFLPVMVLSIYLIGFPPLRNVSRGELLYVGYYLMLGVGSFSSPVDILVFLKPGQCRKMVERDELTQRRAIIRLLKLPLPTA